MSQPFIQIGIDLGTTNSEVAVFTNGKVEIVKNIYQDSFTPSVFGVDKSGNKVVGKKAYENLYKKATTDEVENNRAEVKRLMGTSDKISFTRIEKSFSPEEISAEIIKSLREDIGRKFPELDTRSAVITVPAYFSILQSEATKRAGNLAGFEQVVLLQEPIAAAISYGFQSSKNQNWLVYDFGGGTFDVALISSVEGSLTVLETGGDNYLGGKNIDWAVVEEVIAPAIVDKYKIDDFTRSNPKYQTIFSKLKYLAESAKIDLTQLDKTLIEVDFVLDEGVEISLNIELERTRFERIIEPLVKKTIAISKETVKNSGVTLHDVTKVILVGGPTQIPYLRKMIETELGVKVDTTIDCLTAVATGACLYGLSQRVTKVIEQTSVKKPNTLALKLHYPSLTSETEEPISGSIEYHDGEDYTIQIQSESGLYTSPKIPLKKGKFLESIIIEPNKTNQFWIYVFDKEGNAISIEPESFVITHGLSVSGAPIAHSIGIALQGSDPSENHDEFEIYFEKGSILPLKDKTKSYRTAQKIIRGDDAELPIVVFEGENKNPENNDYVCKLGINGKDLPYDLPVGTPIDVSISINEARELSVSYYIPLIDKGGNLRVTDFAETINVGTLKTNLEQEKEKFSKISSLCDEEEREAVNDLFESATNSVQNASTDPDDKRKANKDIKELRARVEKISESKKGGKLKSEFTNLLEIVPAMMENAPEEINKKNDTDLLVTLKSEGEKAITENDDIRLARTNDQLVALAIKYYYANPNSWSEQLSRHTQGEFTYTNKEAAKYFIEKGNLALKSDNVDGIKDAVTELQNLMVDKNQMSLSSMVSGLTR